MSSQDKWALLCLADFSLLGAWFLHLVSQGPISWRRLWVVVISCVLATVLLIGELRWLGVIGWVVAFFLFCCDRFVRSMRGGLTASAVLRSSDGAYAAVWALLTGLSLVIGGLSVPAGILTGGHAGMLGLLSSPLGVVLVGLALVELFRRVRANLR